MELLRKRYWRSARLLLAACLTAFLLTCIGLPSRADDLPNPAESFLELDSELQAIKAEILEINQEIMLLESAKYPLTEQWVVLVSVANGNLVTLERITLRLDGQTLANHDYSGSEGAALQEGGVHRLHSGVLSAGEHQLEISL